MFCNLNVIKNFVDESEPSIEKSWYSLESMASYREWKETNLEEFLAHSYERKQDFTLEDDDKDALMRMFQDGYFSAPDGKTERTLFMYMRKKYGIKTLNEQELFCTAFKDEIRCFWTELLKMEMDSEYVTKFEYFHHMCHLRRKMPFSLVEIKNNVLPGVMSLSDDLYLNPRYIFRSKYELAHAQKELAKYRELCLFNVNFKDTDKESFLEKAIEDAERAWKLSRGRFANVQHKVKTGLLIFKESVPGYMEHKSLLAIVEGVEEKLAKYEEELVRPVPDKEESKVDSILDTKLYKDQKAAFEVIEDKLRILEPEPPINYFAQLVEQTMRIRSRISMFETALLEGKMVKQANIQLKELCKLYGSTSELEEKKVAEYMEEYLAFGDEYPEQCKALLETIEIVKNVYPNFKEKKPLVDAIVDAETLLFSVDNEMSSYLENKEGQEDFAMVESETVEQIENPKPEDQIEEPVEAAKNTSSWFTSWLY